MSTDPGRDVVLGRIAALAHEHGQAVVGVGPGDVGVPFAYTVGRQWRGLPELLIVGPMPPDTLKLLLNNADSVGVNQPGDYQDVIASHAVRAVPCDPVAGHMTSALALANTDNGQRFLQLLWPDPKGRYPGEPGYDPERFPQPVYAPEDEGEAGV